MPKLFVGRNTYRTEQAGFDPIHTRLQHGQIDLIVLAYIHDLKSPATFAFDLCIGLNQTILIRDYNGPATKVTRCLAGHDFLVL